MFADWIVTFPYVILDSEESSILFEMSEHKQKNKCGRWFLCVTAGPSDRQNIVRKHLRHHKGCRRRQQPRWSIWCQGQQHGCHCQSQLVYSRKKQACSWVFHSVCSMATRQRHSLIMLGLERYSCRFLSIICSFFLLLSLQGYSKVSESGLDTV